MYPKSHREHLGSKYSQLIPNLLAFPIESVSTWASIVSSAMRWQLLSWRMAWLGQDDSLLLPCTWPSLVGTWSNTACIFLTLILTFVVMQNVSPIIVVICSHFDSKEICSRMSAGKWHGDPSNFNSHVNIFSHWQKITEKHLAFKHSHFSVI